MPKTFKQKLIDASNISLFHCAEGYYDFPVIGETNDPKVVRNISGEFCLRADKGEYRFEIVGTGAWLVTGIKSGNILASGNTKR